MCDQIRNNHLRDIGIQTFVLISSFFSSYAVRGLRFLFAHFAKIAIKCKRVTRVPKKKKKKKISTIFCTNEERVTVDSRTKFAVNLSNIQGVMSVYSRKKRSNFCNCYRVNQV